MQNHRFTNELIHESSPYLLQHAHNPVNWHPWNESTLLKAAREDKLILVSIGYSSCHWCHVMEQESFQDENVGHLMNESFVCIKIDREELPDIDHFFMTAVQMTGSQGGWPLNCIALPDGKPVWGGTYFRKDHWITILSEIHALYTKNRKAVYEHAEKLMSGVQNQLISLPNVAIQDANENNIKSAISRWKRLFDEVNGGLQGAPKFPMPVNLEFLLHYGKTKNDHEILGFVGLTLEKISMGGIYDHVGGGFSRYSVDEKWKVPHFEKMLYDNAQLLSLYAKYYMTSPKAIYKETYYESVAFLSRELAHPSGSFYSSLDADSEGTEGKFYVWTESELKEIIIKDYELFADYYGINGAGLWENDKNILVTPIHKEDFCHKTGLTLHELNYKISNWKKILLQNREKRIRPALDDKCITSWNALAVIAFCDGAKAFKDPDLKMKALSTGHFLIEHAVDKKGKLHRIWKNGKPTIPAYLEDFALVIKALIALFEISGEIDWIKKANELTLHLLENHYSEKHGLFFSTPAKGKSIIPAHVPVEDNVIPSGNSVMAMNLLKLSRIFLDMEMEKLAISMIYKLQNTTLNYPYAYAHWFLNLLSIDGNILREVVIAGPDASIMALELQSFGYENIIWAISGTNSEIPILKGRIIPGKTAIYLCSNGTCKMPVFNIRDAIRLLDTFD